MVTISLIQIVNSGINILWRSKLQLATILNLQIHILPEVERVQSILQADSYVADKLHGTKQPKSTGNVWKAIFGA